MAGEVFIRFFPISARPEGNATGKLKKTKKYLEEIDFHS
ncbi:hypothetical protein CPter291_0381 [Collimonas pratensis]|uniref:Uncharacterized protein n=1 Tax=Collimonas pratensis TaxID=279113 RepID=A0A127QRP8_9BURK|nr:hypothetical protein CPter91_0462 [Collimonas pratensis]AMP12671.1 hypothetical protein CPter291_0381 [Collimonas pratensis]